MTQKILKLLKISALYACYIWFWFESRNFSS